MKGGVNNEEAKRLSQQEREIGKKIDVEQKKEEEGTGNREKMKDYKFFWRR